MKVLILCMAFAAVTLAMPVAEEKQEVPIVPSPVPEVKSDNVKPESESQSAVVKENKASAAPEVKSADKSEQIEAKNANVPIDATPEALPEAKAETVPKVKEEIIPEVSEAAPVSSEPEQKSESSQAAEPKPEEKSTQPELKSESVKAPKPEENTAKVEEIIAPSAKSAITEETIDVVSAVKNPAAVADDVMDPAAINPIPDSKPSVSAKSANPEDKKEEPSVSESASVKTINVEEVKDLEPKTENKPVEVAPTSDVSAKPKSAAVSDDSTRVIRDVVPEKKETETPKAEAKAVVEAVKDEVKPVDVQVEPKSAKSAEEAHAPQEHVAESPKVEQPSDVAKEVKSAEVPKEREEKEVIPLAQPVDAAKDVAKPEVKSDETIMNDAPAKEKNNSEESAETSDSSEESGEKSKENAPKP
ncbi:unnamed protein product [Euphydryas editha]|uniref:Uncharacterized protein n=1 Tax=Euphydryas editha TaxID=104508 RepID=A0AAU9UE58_EUPED|nr:unnamed protein product [Euphydryas editha]